jgi:hypothetical protein
MKTLSCVPMVLAASLCALSPRIAAAQAPCAVAAAVVDSARNEVVSVLDSGSPLVTELRQEQGLPKAGSITPVTVVRDRFVCGHLATTFGHDVAPGVSFVVLRVGPLYYAREPDQHRGTGVITDSTYHVVLRLGVPVASPPMAPAGRASR